MPEKTVVKADGTSLVYVRVLAIDDNGNENPFANNLINFNLKGQGKIVGVDNGDALSRER
ncbi:hypothetical protein NW063_01785 [Mycoplasmopsis cynos]|nr:hypothetical protein [Mycoplasmopsis cynos]UWV86567.1 hypothetical protein NW063_01785 [Mycoplasmopsis cynos]